MSMNFHSFSRAIVSTQLIVVANGPTLDCQNIFYLKEKKVLYGAENLPKIQTSVLTTLENA